MKIKNAFLFVLLFTCCTYAQSRSLFDLYKIPRISFHQINLSGDNLLNLNNTSYADGGAEYNSLSVYLNLSHIYFFQSPQSKNNIGTYVDFHYSKTKSVNNPDPAVINESIYGAVRVSSSNSWYISDEKGMFLFFDPKLYALNNRNTITKKDEKRRGVSASIGTGLGRIVCIKEIVQARMIADELKCSLSDDALLKLAGIIEKRDNGEYYAKYKDDYEIYFYKDIAEITGHPEYESKIRQILYSGVYKTSMRERGWEAKLGLRNGYYEINNFWPGTGSMAFTDRQITKGTDLFSSFSYALPIDYNEQFSASAEYSLNLNDKWGRMPLLLLSANFSIDHSYLWCSQLSAIYNIGFAKERDNLENYGVALQSSYSLFNRLAVTVKIQYSCAEYSNWMMDVWTPSINDITKQKEFHITIGFAYHIL
jgi:hypothetical protein